MATLSGALERAARLFGANTAAVNDFATLTWREVLERVQRAASALASHGMGAGDRIAVISANCHDAAQVMHAALWLGAVPVPINHRLSPPEIARILDMSGSRLLAGGQVLRDVLPSLPSRFAALPAVWLADSDFGTWQETYAPRARHRGRSDDIAVIYFTSGTQGLAKGVPLTHQQIIANAMQVGLCWPRDHSAVCLHVAPMYHSADLLMFSSMLHGAANAYLPQFTPAAFRDAVQRHAVTDTMLVPAMIGLLLRADTTQEAKLVSLKRMLYGASPMPAGRARELMSRLPGLRLMQGYGLSETSPLLTLLSHEEHLAATSGAAPQLLTSCGRPLAGVELRVVNEAGEEVAACAHGEIQVRGPNVFGGYLDEDAANSGAFVDGWFRTGDIGYQDDHGYVYILDRKSNVINRGGEKLYPIEIEDILSAHPRIAECAVVGVAGRAEDNIIVAYVVTRDGGQLSAGELRAYCQGRIAAYKIPRRVHCVAELPRNSVGKILKYKLQERA